MAAPNKVQSASQASQTTPKNIAFTVTEGNTLLIGIVQNGNLTRDYSVSDNVNGAWTRRVQITNGAGQRFTEIWSKENTLGGALTVTVSALPSGGTPTFHYALVEVEPCTLDVSGSYLAAANAFTHYSAASPGLDSTQGDVYAFVAGFIDVSGGMLTKGTDYTLIASGSTYLFQDRSSAAALVDDRGPWSSTTAAKVQGAMVVFKSAATDTTKPTVVSASHTDDTLTVVFSEPVLGTGTGISVSSTLSPVAIGSPSGVGTDTWAWTFDRTVYSSAHETLTLTAATNDIEDAAGNTLDDFASMAITNGSAAEPDLTSPLLADSYITADGTEFVTTFDEVVTGATGFTLASSAGTALVATYSSGSGTVTLRWLLNRVPAYDESVSAAYAPGDISDIAGNALAAIPSFLTSNRVGSPSGTSGGGSVIGSAIIKMVGSKMIDRAKGETFYLYFTSTNPDTKQLATLVGTPAVACYPNGSLTEFVTGVTLTVDHDGIVGRNQLAIDTSGADFVSGYDYNIALTAGTVGAYSAVGEIVGEFSLDRYATESLRALNSYKPLKPAVDDRALSVGAAGEVAALGTDAVSAASIATAAVTKVQNGLALEATVNAVGTVASARPTLAEIEGSSVLAKAAAVTKAAMRAAMGGNWAIAGGEAKNVTISDAV